VVGSQSSHAQDARNTFQFRFVPTILRQPLAMKQQCGPMRFSGIDATGGPMKRSTDLQRQILTSLATGLLLGWTLSLNAGVADTAAPASSLADVYPHMRTVLSTGSTVVGEPIHYPSGAPAVITAVEIRLEPGQRTGWHAHPVPLLGYVLEGELSVDYGPNGQRTYRKGDALAEAMSVPHEGRNRGPSPVRILAVFIGMEGLQGSVPAPPAARR
jgi:quercetin dioxygenase-like cupin family protein